MADLPSITGTIGGTETPIFIGTPSIPGAGAIDSALNTVPGINKADNALTDSINSLLFPSGLPGGGAIENVLNGTPDKNATPSLASQWSSTVADFFFRAAIMIVGLIFIAVGLSMFKPPAVVQETHNNIKRAGKVIRKVIKP